MEAKIPDLGKYGNDDDTSHTTKDVKNGKWSSGIMHVLFIASIYKFIQWTIFGRRITIRNIKSTITFVHQNYVVTVPYFALSSGFAVDFWICTTWELLYGIKTYCNPDSTYNHNQCNVGKEKWNTNDYKKHYCCRTNINGESNNTRKNEASEGYTDSI